MTFYKINNSNCFFVVEKETQRICILGVDSDGKFISVGLVQGFYFLLRCGGVKLTDINSVPKAAYDVAYKWSLKTVLSCV